MKGGRAERTPGTPCQWLLRFTCGPPEAAPGRGWLRLARNQVRNLNSHPTLHSQYTTHPGTGKGKNWLVGQWISQTPLTRQDVNPDCRHLWTRRRADTSMPASAYRGLIPISALSLIPTGRQQFYGSGSKPTIHRKSKKSCKNNDSAPEHHQFINFFLIFKSMSWKARQPQTALICQIAVGPSDLVSHLHMDGVFLFYFGGTTAFHT